MLAQPYQYAKCDFGATENRTHDAKYAFAKRIPIRLSTFMQKDCRFLQYGGIIGAGALDAVGCLWLDAAFQSVPQIK